MLLRDRLLAKVVREQAEARGLTVIEIDGACPVEEMAHRIEGIFARDNNG